MIDYKKLSEDVINYRRDLHQIPELGFLVYKTNSYLRSILSKLDCKVDSIVKTGLVAFFDFGKEKTICFRADMDALPIEENTGLTYASMNEGVMHACGHDGHMAIMLGFARLLNKMKSDGIPAEYNALLLFQPAEETIEGAIEICNTNVFDYFNVESIFGLHLWPFLEKGEISTKPGPMMAKSTAIAVEIEGVSAHCGQPDQGIDALEAACRFVRNLYDYKEKCITDRCVLKFGKMRSGNVRNAISPYTRLDGTMRTFHEETWEKLTDALHNFAREEEDALGVKFSIDTSKYHPAVINDENLYLRIKSKLLDHHLNFVELRRPVMIAEDFSFFEENLPGVFFFLGTGSKTPLHSDNYDFDDSVLIEGVKLFKTIFI